MKSFLQVFREFFILGLTSFGGPTAHVAFFRERFVGDRKWLTESEFADLLALCQFLPGPASSQLGLSIGWRKAGWGGAFAAWLAFTIPSAILMVLFGIGLTTFGGGLDPEAGWLRGLQIAVVVVIAGAVVSMWTSLCPDRRRKLIALVVAAVILATASAWMQLVVIALGAVSGLVFLKKETDSRGLSEAPDPLKSASIPGIACLIAFFALLLTLPFAVKLVPGSAALETFSAMYRSGSLVFGGGHVVLPLLSREVVDTAWVRGEEFLAGYGVAQAVPGPLFTFAAYLGSLIEGPGGAWGMAAVALVGIFLPAWLLVLGVMPFWHRIVAQPSARAALAGANAAVVGLLGAALYEPVWIGSVRSTEDVVFLIGVAAVLLVLKIPAWAVVIAAGVAGWMVL
ncbi:MAG: chromate efflux transporter [Verrucomicrobiales bacterium]|nr:chromate efflux transporter [Verrucomicrobiales bacterium]